MWQADKLEYREQDNFARAYKGDELVWQKQNTNIIYYVTTDNTIINPPSGKQWSDFNWGSNVNFVSNTYTNGQFGYLIFSDIVKNIEGRTCTTSGGVTTCEDGPFSSNVKLSKVILPKNLSASGIEAAAFQGCTSLESIVLPETIIYINRNTFYGCTSLKDLVIGGNIADIGLSAFEGCTSLESINIPSLLRLSGYAFYGCTSLTNVTLTSLDSMAYGTGLYYGHTFGNCINLKYVNVQNLRITGQYAFEGCTSLENINLPKIEIVSKYAFTGCTSLKKINISNRVTDIGDGAFYGCSSLIEFIINATTPPTLGTDVFTGTPQNMLIKVPSGSVQAYKTASGWSNYASKIVSQ